MGKDIVNVICPVCHSTHSISTTGGMGVKKYNMSLDPATETFILIQESIGGGGRGVKTKGTGFITKQKLTLMQALSDPRYSRLARRVMDTVTQVFVYLEKVG